MEIIKGKEFCFKDTCVTIGKFDGVHLGHRRILSLMNSIKKEQGLKTAVLTFDFSYFSDNAGERLNTYDEKISLLEKSDIDMMIDYPFDDDTRMLLASDFVEKVLIDKLGMKAIVVGDNFRFGFKALGDPELLKKLGNIYGFDTYVVPCVKYDGLAISSTRIRDELRSGHISEAEKML